MKGNIDVGLWQNEKTHNSSITEWTTHALTCHITGDIDFDLVYKDILVCHMLLNYCRRSFSLSHDYWITKHMILVCHMTTK